MNTSASIKPNILVTRVLPNSSINLLKDYFNVTLNPYDKVMTKAEILDHIPSFYLLSILPDYYEKLISKTLDLFEKSSIFPNIRFITLCNNDNEVIYQEEFLLEDGVKKSYGVILIHDNDLIIDSKNISFYRKTLRNLLDMNKSLNKILMDINPEIIYKGWSVKSEEDLEQIKIVLDRRF